MATTTNYSWTTPDDTALVKDGAAAIRTLGSSVDTTVKALNPGTTAGDIDYYTSSTAKSRIAIGSTGNVLTVAGGVPTWAAPAGGSDNFTLINSGGTALTGASTITVSGISGKNKLMIIVKDASSVNAAWNCEMRFNADSTLKYDYNILKATSSSSVNPDFNYGSNNSMDLFGMSGGAAGAGQAFLTVEGAGSSGLKCINFVGTNGNYFGNNRIGQYTYSGTSAISSVSVISSSGNFDAGTIYVYGA